MLNNIRGMLNRRSESVKSPDSGSSDGTLESTSAEGFLCPQCFNKFPTADALQNHYESAHHDSVVNSSAEGRSAFVCPECKMKFGSDIEMTAHVNRHHSVPQTEAEIEAMHYQLKALEEGKALLQKELETLHKQTSELSRENAKIKEERDEFKIKATKLTEDLADLRLNFDTAQAQRLSLESALRLSEERVKSLEIEIQQRFATDDVNALKTSLVSVQQMMNELNMTRENEKIALEKQCKELEETCTKLMVEKSKLESALEHSPKAENVESLDKKIKELSEEKEQLKSEFLIKETEIHKLKISLEKFKDYDDYKQQLFDKTSSLDEVQRLSNEKDSLVVKLEAELKSVKEKIEEMKLDREQLFSKIQEGEGASAAMLQLQEENTRLQEQFLQQQSVNSQSAQDTEAKFEDLRTQLKKSNSEAHSLQSKCSELEGNLSAISNDLKSTRGEKEKLSKELKEKIVKLDDTVSMNKKNISELESRLAKTQSLLNEANLQIKSLKEQLKEDKNSAEKHVEQLVLEKQSLEKRLSDLGIALPQVQEELLKKNKELSDALKELQCLKESLRKLEAISEGKESKLAQLQKAHEESQSRVKELESEIEKFDASKAEFCDRISSLNEQLVERELREADLSSVFDSLNEAKKQLTDKCESLEEENKTLRSSVTVLQNEKNSLLSEIDKERKALSDLSDRCSLLDDKIVELTEQCQLEKENSEKFEKESIVIKEMLVNVQMQTQKRIEVLEADCAKQVSEIQETVKALENQLEEVEDKNSNLISSLEESKKLLENKERELEENEAKLTARVGLLTENVKTLKEDLLAEVKKKESLQHSFDEVSEEKLGLEAKLSNALDERNGLLERCLKSESEWEKLQKSNADIRRKYEDTVAALQELGRENQTLQVENTKHLTRRWADDSKATNCTACNKLFGITVRKHHCRNCGEIFCNECSAKTATTVSSKNPVRVCDICYAEVTR